MALDADPYRTLGLPRGASLDEVKRAYRKLAKANHPDAAGEAALPRFLAIQTAYEQLLGGSETTTRGRGAAATPRRPWQADPDRGDATRRAYGGRAGGPRPGASGPRPGAGGTPRPGATGATDAGGSTGARGRSGQSGPSADTGRHRPSEPRGTKGQSRPTGDPDPSGPPGAPGGNDGPRKAATLGSTSYDGAADGPFEPDWGGASWYGTTSGTYWTLNPKEYADPRKHGPEYQARARRAARERASKATDATDATGTAPDSNGEPIHTTSSWWDSTSGQSDADAPQNPNPNPAQDQSLPANRGRTSADAEPPAPDLGQAATDLGRALTDERSGGLAARVVRAVVGWLPIALGLGSVVGELTGCGRFAATCDGSTDLLVLALQVVLLGVLLLFPALTSLATTAAIALLAVAVVAALMLSATGGAADGESRRTALGAVLLLGWLAGLAFAIARRVRALRSSAGPVS